MLDSLASAALMAAVAAGLDEPDPPQGVILFMADDAGSECFGCYGGESYATPHIDRLAASGMRFTHAHSQPVCTPSRVKLLTGLSSVRNYQDFSILRPGERTLGHVMQDHGLATAVVGKWQLYGAQAYEDVAGSGTRPEDAGFDVWRLWQVERIGRRYWSPTVEEAGELRRAGEEVYGPDLFLEFAIEFLREHRDRPFFLYWPSVLPHSPHFPTPRSEDPRAAKGVEHFGAMVEYLDTQVGRLMAEVEALGLRERTLVVFTSDNGTDKDIRSKRGGEWVKGAKSLTLDAATHVPLIASRPGAVAAGSVCEDLVDFSDLLPTLAEAVEAPVPDGLDGRSFHPQLMGEEGQPRRWLFCYHDPRPDEEGAVAQRWTRDKRFKLYGDGRFFDVLADPLEQAPLARASLDEASRKARRSLRRALDAMPERGPARSAAPSGEDDGPGAH